MSKLTAIRGAQNVLCASFTLNFDDTMVNTAGDEVDFGKVNLGGASTGKFDIIPLPPGAVVVGGQVAVTTAFDTAGYDVIIGDADDDDRFFATADVKGVGVVALLTPGYVSTGKPVRLQFSTDDVCTTGVLTVNVLYKIVGKANEVV